MSDHEVPQNEQPDDVDHVIGSANEGLDAAAAARADVPGSDDAARPVDPDMAAFEAAEREHPGTFAAPDGADADTGRAEADASVPFDRDRADDEPVVVVAEDKPVEDPAVSDAAYMREADADADRDPAVVAADERVRDAAREDDTIVMADASEHRAAPTVAETAYAADTRSWADTQLVPAEPVAPPPAAPQPIFVQAPEPPRELGNRGAAGAIGLIATVCFAVLYLGAIIGLGALSGDVTLENIGTALLEPLTTWSFWVPVVVFFLAFWLLGAIVNRARWGKWVIFGLFVAAATYGGHLLGQLFQAPFWRLTTTQSAELVNEQLLAPLAIAAFLFARELTIWFGAWVARSGARKKALNAEAQAEYERTLEAGPAALR